MAVRPTGRALVVLVLFVTTCTPGRSDEAAQPPRVAASPSASAPVTDASDTSSGGTDVSGPTLPRPDARLPRDPARLAERLTATTLELRRSIEAWRASGGTEAWPPPRSVPRLALDQQRIYQLLGTMGRARRASTFELLPPGIRAEGRDAAYASRRLASGLVGIVVDDPAEMRTRAPLPAATLRRFYARASRRFDVPWTLLAAVHFMETKFGRVISPSWAGAQGPMQFLPSTWEAFGMGGDIHDPRDAILGAANYLAATGSPHDDRAALWAYNPVDYYGDAVLAYDRLMRRDVRAFYALYNWQVFVRGRAGLVQLTGPGADV